MPVIHNPDSAYSRENARWDLPKREGGFNANGFEAFPTMLYKAFARENGKVMCGDPLVAIGEAQAESFARKCQLIVQDQAELETAVKRGWAETPDAALERYEQDKVDLATAAAERHFSDQRLSASAQAEAKAADEATHEQVADVPVRRKRGRPKKAKAVSGATS
jgi:hypothetical protein|tara:strand:- start:100 stop:591 length:492 start_codon:yes stop_codon:yes gene_type:complete